MYIKQIIIQGFKSYKEQTVIEPFSPKTNIIVGRNGAGKSNFFSAIRFVLSDAYTGMSREERQALLHEGSGSAVMTAYVEIIFDNSDGRFPTGKDTLVLRRTIGLKKDEYSLDKKNATKNDVMSILESAGFSRSNPYYIVPQGRVTALTNMKDTERLTLLKEVAGTQIYEARRAESLKIMDETENKRNKIDETLEYIKERLSELEEEMEELRSYQEKDKERRCLEYTYFEREQTMITEKLAEIEEMRQGGMDTSDENLEALQAGEQVVLDLAGEIKQIRHEFDLLQRERTQFEEDRRDMAKAQARKELDVKNLTEGLSASEQARLEHQQELKIVKAAIASRNAELGKILPEYNHRRTKENEVQQNFQAAKAAMERLQNKQGRNQSFKSKADRDKALKKQIDEEYLRQSEQKANRIDATEQVSSVQADIKRLDVEISELRDRLENWNANRIALAKKDSAARDRLDKLADERKLLRREEEKFEAQIDSLRQEWDRAEKEMSYTMDRDTARGISTVRRLKRELNISGIYGTLAELLDVHENYRLAVEQTGGGSLFQYVVENADIATQLIERLQKDHGGRLTFMPLAQIRIKRSNLPNARDAIPMLDKIDYDKKYEAAFNQVFGKTVICPNLNVAGQYARSHGCDAITPDGDTTNKKGAMTGGYIDPRKSRILAVRAVNKSRFALEEAQVRLAQIRKEGDRKEQDATVAMSERQKSEQFLRQFDDTRDSVGRELRAKVNEHSKRLDLLEAVEKQRDSADQAIKNVGDDISSLEAEIASEFKKSLTTSEERLLENLEKSVMELQKERNEMSDKRRELETRKQMVEIDLRQNLQQKLDALNTQDIDVAAGSTSGNLEDARKDLERITKAAAALDLKLQENEDQLEQAQIKILNLQKENAEREEQLELLAQSIEKHQRRMEKGVAKKAALQNRAAECQKNIRDLGVLPEEAFTKFQKLDSKAIENRLRKVNEAMKKFKHVNKKAFEQYNNFTSQQESLTKRRKELDDALDSIRDLVDVLDQRKDEKIERTFKQVSREFATIFERLVPAGRGRLVIQRKADPRPRDIEESEDDRDGVENYTGVGITVSFNSKHDDQQRIQQLSGGQKSLCALALVFAIQQCDPAPFYLFDEIDANLDAQYRTAVAEMLEDISNRQSQTGDENAQDEGTGGMSGQFICTTFRPEMLLVADKCYGVTFHNKTSGIDTVSREEALRFVDGQAPK